MDNNLEYDAYFYERQEELHKIKKDILHNKIKMQEYSEVWKNIRQDLKTIQNK